MKNTWTSLLVIIFSAFGYHLVSNFIGGRLLTFIYMSLLLLIGFFMNPKRSKNNRWVGKVLISLLVVFIFGIKLELFVFDEFYQLLNTIGLSGSFLDILLVYCGWVFYQI